MNCAARYQKRPIAMVVMLLLLLGASSASACPGCSYERMLLTDWYQKVWILKLALPLVFVFNRLDVVRVLYVFFAYTYGFIVAFKYLVWYSHPAVGQDLVNGLANAGLMIMTLNIPDAALLLLLSSIPFFRRDKTKGLPIWQIVAFAVVAGVTGWMARLT